MKIVMYSRPGCVQCRYTLKEFGDDVAIEVIDIAKDADAERDAKMICKKNDIAEMLPIVVVSRANGKANEVFSGFRLDKIRQIKKELDK